jgi:hypothetical protein
MSVSAHALEMRLKIRRLMREHNVCNEPLDIPLVAPLDCPQIFEGFASHTSLDLDRVKFAKRAFIWDDPLPPLLVKHDRGTRAGVIDDLYYR